MNARAGSVSDTALSNPLGFWSCRCLTPPLHLISRAIAVSADTVERRDRAVVPARELWLGASGREYTLSAMSRDSPWTWPRRPSRSERRRPFEPCLGTVP